MVAPNKVTRVDPKLRNRTNRHGKPGALLCLSLLLLCAFGRWLFRFEALTNVSSNEATTTTMTTTRTTYSLVDFEKDNTLSHEQMFTSTLKDCLPQKKKNCKTYVPPAGQQRVALLAPRGNLTKFFFHLVETVLSQAKQKNQSINIDWIPTSHIAPYGYGKTHGLTRIIRIVPVPLLIGVTDTLDTTKSDGTILSLADAKANLRQQIRYHCRLNHVSAHTALWTLTLKELSQTPIEDLIAQIYAFLDLKEEAATTNVEKLVSTRQSFVNQFATDNNLFLKNLKESTKLTSSDKLMQVMDDVLLDEMRISKNLTAWPCQSFWTVGEASSSATRLQLSPIISKVAESLSPNCTSSLVSCFVKRDKCEAKGDGKCS